MGHTHYFNTARDNTRDAAQLETLYQSTIIKCQEFVREYNERIKLIDPKHPARLSGYSAHARVGQYGGLKFNGTKELSCEDFIMREHFSENLDGAFCKTRQHSYDTAVVACLIILKHYLGDAFQVSSDARAADFSFGLLLVRDFLDTNDVQNPLVKRKVKQV